MKLPSENKIFYKKLNLGCESNGVNRVLTSVKILILAVITCGTLRAEVHGEQRSVLECRAIESS